MTTVNVKNVSPTNASNPAGGASHSPSNFKSSNTVSLKAIEVPQVLQDGEKFIKWDEDSNTGTPVTLKVDPHGFYLYWTDQNHDVDVLDIATIRDTRTGRYAKIPKDVKLRQIVTMGSGQDTLEEKTVTVCCATDFVQITFTNFCCTRKEVATFWADALMRLAYNLTQINGTPNMYLHKAYTKLTLCTDKNERIPLKNVIKMFAINKEDKKRVENALHTCKLPYGKNDSIALEQFHIDDFLRFVRNLTRRIEVERVFNTITGSKDGHMTASQFVDFLNKTQRDPRLNEILHPYSNTARAADIIAQYETDASNAQKAHFSVDGFLRYLMSDNNNLMSAAKFDLSDDMDQPLAHYFINSSHNTYLTGHQLTGKSSTEIYRQCLLAGCRCVELDFWNGKTEEPVIVHGYTFVPDISAKEVLEAIAESAFKTSDFPVILSFENHCNPRQQAKIANYCRDIFGEMLLDTPLDEYQLEAGCPMPPPSVLRRKIIIKNKKKHHHHHHHHHNHHRHTVQKKAETETSMTTTTSTSSKNGDVPKTQLSLSQLRQNSKESSGSDDDDVSSTDEDGGDTPEMEQATVTVPEQQQQPQQQQQIETEAGAEISALVNYIQPVHFSSFDTAKRRNRNYEMSSFDEKQATSLLKEYPVQFVNYNKHQLSRVYPAGTRFDSSNFMPQVFWNAGCQLVALNFQTLDLAMQLNLGIFEYNLRCGYLLKPEFMRRTDRHFYPFAESTVDGIIAGTVKVTVISGQFLTDKRCGTYVEVEMYGLPADTVRKRFRTRMVPNNGINPIYDEEPFVFKKVVLPELASLRLAVYEDSGRFLGHRILPVVGLCPGYRHVCLRTELGQPLPLATLFLHIVVKDYVPDGLSDFAEALANPIKYQSDLDKRTQQLAVLTEGMDLTDCPAVSVPPPPHQLSAEDTAKTPELSGTVTNGSPPGKSKGDTTTSTVVTPLVSTESTISEVEVASSSSGTESQQQIVAESVEQIFSSKAVRDKRIELDKKLDSLRKKFEKKRSSLQLHKAVAEPSGGSEKLSKLMNMRLVKRLSSKTVVTSDSTDTVPVDSGVDAECCQLPRSQSERLLAVSREYIRQERELREKYHDLIFNTAEKAMKTSQLHQEKLLRDHFERNTADLMRKLQSDHREEMRALAKIHRNREQFTRVKREALTAVVGRGVTEREKLGKAFEGRRDELHRQHEEIREAFVETRDKAKTALTQEFESRLASLEGGAASSTAEVATTENTPA